MNTTLKKLASISLCLGVTFSLCAGEDWLERMRKIFGSDPMYDVGDKNLPCPVRELKNPGEMYQHFLTMNVEGVGRSVTKRSLSWFNTAKSFRFNHETSAILSERILSSEQELQNGIIRTEFTLNALNEVLLKGGAGISVGALDSKSLIHLLKDTAHIANPTINATGDAMIALGLAALAAPAPELIHKIAGGGVAIGGALLKFANNAFWKMLGKKTNEENEFIIPGKSLANIYPGAESAVALLRNLQGSKVHAVWEYGKGYTKLELETNAVKDEDKELLAKMIYRLNPIGARHVFPKGCEDEGDTWLIKSSDIGGLLMTTGFKYDTLTGDVAVVNRGLKEEKYKDEKNPLNVYRLTTIDRMRNEINFVKGYGANKRLACSFVPHGELKVVNQDSKGFVPLFVRDIKLYGDLSSRMSETDGLLKELSFDDSTIKVSFNYSQLRMQDGAAHNRK